MHANTASFVCLLLGHLQRGHGSDEKYINSHKLLLGFAVLAFSGVQSSLHVLDQSGIWAFAQRADHVLA